jgi:phosphonate transport system ATP-binding protein
MARSSLEDNVALPLVYAGVSRADRNQRARDMLAKVGLEGYARSLPNRISGGQQQRVAIARALVQEPSIILADEPVASLDPRNARLVMDALLEINRRYKLTVLVNIHSLDLAREYCERLVGLAGGRLVFDGPPAKLTDAVARELYGLEADEAVGRVEAPAAAPLAAAPALPAAAATPAKALT